MKAQMKIQYLNDSDSYGDATETECDRVDQMIANAIVAAYPDAEATVNRQQGESRVIVTLYRVDGRIDASWEAYAKCDEVISTVEEIAQSVWNEGGWSDSEMLDSECV